MNSKLKRWKCRPDMVPLRVVLIFLLQTFLCGALDGSSFSPQDGDVLAARMERSLLQLGQTSLNSSSRSVPSSSTYFAVPQKYPIPESPSSKIRLLFLFTDVKPVCPFIQLKNLYHAQNPRKMKQVNLKGSFWISIVHRTHSLLWARMTQ